MKNIRRIIREEINEVVFNNDYKHIDDFNDPRFVDDADWGPEDEASDEQDIESKDTSGKRVPMTFKKSSGIEYAKGSLNFDIGGGKYNLGTEALKNDFDVENVIFDPYNRNIDFNNKAMDKLEENGGADSVTVNSCLNVIKGRKFIENVIHQAAECLKKDGHAIFKIYQGNSKGIGDITTKGYQQNKRAVKYIPLIHKYFKEVWLNHNKDCIIASNPIEGFEDKAKFYPDKNGEPRYLNLKRK